MIAYKLTNQDLTTHGGCKWEIGVKKTTSGKGNLCSKGWLHAYESPLLAILHNPIYGDFENPRLFKVEASGKIKKDGQMKLGATEMTLLKEIEVPEITDTQRVAYGILCALEVYQEEKFVSWANKWLSGQDRSEESARSASEATDWANRAAYYTANRAACAAACAAAGAADLAARAAACADWAAVWAAGAAYYAANPEINLKEIAVKAMEY